MKVLHIFHELKFSGAEIMYVDAAPLFRKKGCSLTAMATAKELGNYASNFKKNGYSILHMPIPPLNKYLSRIYYYKNIIALFNLNKYDTIHIHSLTAMWGFALCAWLCKIKSVYTFHNVFPTSFYSYPYHLLLRFSAKYIFNCCFQTISDSVFENEKKLYLNNTIKIYNWYNDNRFYPCIDDNEKYKFREELNIEKSALVLISIGGCSGIKRHSDILKALPFILDKIPNTIYLHLGKGETECEEKKLAKSLGISESVIFCNNQQDVRKYLISSDIYLMTSKFEGIPITTIEAMACGIPTILYDVPGLRDFNNELNSSILIKEDIRLLSKCILTLVDDKILKRTIVNNAFITVEKKFRLKVNANQIFNIYIN